MATDITINKVHIMLSGPTTKLYENYNCHQNKMTVKRGDKIWIDFCENTCAKNAASEIAKIYDCIEDYYDTVPDINIVLKPPSKKAALERGFSIYPAMFCIKITVKHKSDIIYYFIAVVIKTDDIATDSDQELYCKKVKLVASEFLKKARKEKALKLFTIGNLIDKAANSQ